MYDNHIQPCIVEPTRIISGNKPSIVDNIFTNIIDKQITSGNLVSKISDHLPNFVIINDLVSYSKKQKISKRDFTNFKENDYLTDISSISVDHIIYSTDINEIYSDFHSQLITVIDKHAPIKTYSIRESKWLRKPWYTKGIQKSIKVKNKLYKKYIKSKKDLFWFIQYKFYKNSVNSLTKISKQNYYVDYFRKHIKNSTKVWAGINEIIHKRKAKDMSELFFK